MARRSPLNFVIVCPFVCCIQTSTVGKFRSKHSVLCLDFQPAFDEFGVGSEKGKLASADMPVAYRGLEVSR